MFKGTRREDLVNLLSEIGETANKDETVDQLRSKIENSKRFKDDREEVTDLLSSIVEERKMKLQAVAQNLEMEKIKLAQLDKELELAKLKAKSQIPINCEKKKV